MSMELWWNDDWQVTTEEIPIKHLLQHVFAYRNLTWIIQNWTEFSSVKRQLVWYDHWMKNRKIYLSYLEHLCPYTVWFLYYWLDFHQVNTTVCSVGKEKNTWKWPQSDKPRTKNGAETGITNVSPVVTSKKYLIADVLCFSLSIRCYRANIIPS